MRFLKYGLTLGVAMLLVSPGLARSATSFHWVRLHLSYATPSEVFTRLGLTHITRHGYTRGLSKGTLDRTFPPGLTDVVPYDAGHALIVRGTLAGVTQFRQRVAAVDVPDPRWQVTLTLARKTDDEYQPAGSRSQAIGSDQPLTAAFRDAGSAPQYQISVHVNRDGTLAVMCRVALTLAASSDAPMGILVPTQVWTTPVIKDMRPGDMLTFDDTSAVRAAARQRLGQPAEDQSQDYQLQVQVVPAPVAGTGDTALPPSSDGPVQ